MKKVKISREQAAEIFWGIKTPIFIKITIVTVKSGDKLNSGCPFDYIRKKEAAVVLTGFNPKDRDGSGWGTRLSNALLCHKGHYYLTFKKLKNPISVEYRSNGLAVPKDVAENWIASTNVKPFKQEVRLDNLLGFTLKGVTYEIGA